MTISADAAEIGAGYEALRARALGEIPAATPRGLAVLMRDGLPAWMRALAPTDRSTLPARPAPSRELTGPGIELVSLLTEMVLASGKRCFT